jgi:multidrug transporter EmrE-like cation transporter
MSLVDITIMSIIEIIGDFGWKGVARQGGGALNFTAGIGGYIGLIYYLIKSLRVGNVTYVNGMWDGISGIMETAAAYILFGERLNSTSQYFGILLIATGLILLKMGGISH